jgi:hypothetical protein
MPLTLLGPRPVLSPEGVGDVGSALMTALDGINFDAAMVLASEVLEGVP